MNRKRYEHVAVKDFSRRLDGLATIVKDYINKEFGGHLANEQEELEKLVYLRLADLLIDLELDPEVPDHNKTSPVRLTESEVYVIKHALASLEPTGLSCDDVVDRLKGKLDEQM